jgi:hypothetical protein
VTNHVLAWDISGNTTQIGLYLFYAAPPTVAEASTSSVAVDGTFVLNVANVNTAQGSKSRGPIDLPNSMVRLD